MKEKVEKAVVGEEKKRSAENKMGRKRTRTKVQILVGLIQEKCSREHLTVNWWD
jgi:hypothetical protein